MKIDIRRVVDDQYCISIKEHFTFGIEIKELEFSLQGLYPLNECVRLRDELRDKYKGDFK